LKGGDGCALSYVVGKAIAIVPNEKNYQFVFLVFIGFYWFFLRPLRGINSHRLRRNYVSFIRTARKIIT
jgi:hypothetical protein